MCNVWIPQIAERIQTGASSRGPSPAVHFVPTVTNPTGSDSISDTRVSPDHSDFSMCYNLDRRSSGLKVDEQSLCGVGEDGTAWNMHEEMSHMWSGEVETSWESCFWNEEDACFLQQQLYDVGPWVGENLVT